MEIEMYLYVLIHFSTLLREVISFQMPLHISGGPVCFSGMCANTFS
jgi:hypothetical protein